MAYKSNNMQAFLVFLQTHAQNGNLWLPCAFSSRGICLLTCALQQGCCQLLSGWRGNVCQTLVAIPMLRRNGTFLSLLILFAQQLWGDTCSLISVQSQSYQGHNLKNAKRKAKQKTD